MIVGINYTDDGSRTIAYMYYVPRFNNDDVFRHNLINNIISQYDEVYIVESFDPNDQSFIDAVVTQGCRL